VYRCCYLTTCIVFANNWLLSSRLIELLKGDSALRA